jgi:hypothetical protein
VKPSPTLTHEEEIDKWATDVAEEVLAKFPRVCPVLAENGPALAIEYEDSWLQDIPESARNEVLDNLHDQLGELCGSLASPSS